MEDMNDDATGTCYPSPDQFSSCKDLLKWSALTAVVWILGILACLGNAFVIIWRLVKERSNVVNVLVLNLGLSDFLMGIYLLIIAVADTIYRDRYAYFESEWRGSGFCTAASILSTLSSEMSVYMLVVITADRVITILFTFTVQRLTLKKTGVIIAVGWLVSAFIAVLPLFGGSYFDGFMLSNSVCLSYNPTVGISSGWEFSVFVLSLNLLSFIFILVSYAAIFRHYLKTKKILSKLSSRSIKSREIALARKLIFILTTDFICWVPIITIKYLSVAGVAFPDWVAPVLAVVILPMNSSLNPFLYTVSALVDERKRKTLKSTTNTTETDHKCTSATPNASPQTNRAQTGSFLSLPKGSPLVKRSPAISQLSSKTGSTHIGQSPLSYIGKEKIIQYDNLAYKDDDETNTVTFNNNS
jgi:hypothetical protein